MKNNILIVTEDKSLFTIVQHVNELLGSPFFLKKAKDNEKPSRASIVLLDLDHITEKQMAVFNGFSYLVAIKEYFQHDEIRKLFKKGAFDCLKKPVTEEDFYKLFQDITKTQQHSLFSSGKSEQEELAKDDLKMSLAYDLIFGNVKHSKKIWDRSQFAGLSTIPNTCLTICIDDFYRLMKNKSEIWRQSIRNEIIDSVHVYFAENRVEEKIVIINGPEKVVVLLSLPVQNNVLEYRNISISCAEKMKQIIKECTGHSVTIGVGNYYEDARNLHLSYQESLQALENKFFTGSNTVIHINDVDPFTNEMYLLQMNEIMIMANQLTMGDVESVKSSLNRVINMISSQINISPKLFKIQTLDLLSTLSQAAINGGAHVKEVLTTQLHYAKELLALENLDQICQWLHEVIDQLLDLILSNHNESSIKSVQKALFYINNHFTEEISLESVANQVHLSTNYFSHIFKKTTGSSFIEYLTHLRMDKAQSLLMDLTCTIYQISCDVGYSNPRYFSRVFKSYFGVTPSEFRNSMLVTNIAKKVKTS
ncbi:helix-turn-helix domain-containing protein [Cytobacillus depressus]|nr:helix-turn-helix domain-containing protein [Cytobacillus depressus]